MAVIVDVRKKDTVHYYPTAMMLFVTGFGEVIEEEVTMAVTDAETREISSLSITLTVRNNPGTFSATLVDTANKFIIPDEPGTEITALNYLSKRKTRVRVTEQTAQTKRNSNNPSADFKTQFKQNTLETINSGDEANYYSDTTYQEWLDKAHIIYVEAITGKKYPAQFITNTVGEVKQRWVFNSNGDIILLSNSIAEDTTLLSKFLDTNEITTTATLIDVQGKKSSISVTLLKKTNYDLVEGKYKDRYEQGDAVGEFRKGRCKISAMDRVVIFLPPRFNSDGTFVQDPANVLIRAFTGVVNTVQEGYSENENTISIEGEDITKYMRISVINVNPALDLDRMEIVDQSPDENIQVWSTILKGLTTPEIIRLLTLGGESVGERGEGEKVSVDGIGYYKLAGEAEDDPDLVYDLASKSFVTGKVDRGSQYVADAKVRRADFTAILGTLFKESSVHIINPFRDGSPLIGFRPYELSVNNSYSFYQADFKTRRDIAYQAAEDSDFLFYADRKGHIWFHPRRFSAAWIFAADIPEAYIIDNLSIQSYGFVEDDSNIYTSVYVSTEPDFGMEQAAELGLYHASYREDSAVLKYGQRIFVASNPIVNIKTSGGTPGSISTDSQSTSSSSYLDSGWWKEYSQKLFDFIASSTIGSKFNLTVLSGYDTGRALRSAGAAYNPGSFHITGDAFDLTTRYLVDNTYITKAQYEAVLHKVNTKVALTAKETDIKTLIELFKVFAVQEKVKYGGNFTVLDMNHFQAIERTIRQTSSPKIPQRNIGSNSIDPQQSITLYAKSLMQRILAGKYQGQITLNQRIELEPGRPVYVPIRNRIYLVETVDHNIVFGSQSQTTIHLSYGRKPWEMLPELLTFAAKDEVYLTDGKIISRRLAELDKNSYSKEPLTNQRLK
jgi:hypothetical protein